MTDYNKIITTVNSITPDYQFIPDLNNTIVIDTSENRIGINTITPDENIHVSGGTIKTQDLIVLGDLSVNNFSSDLIPRDDLSYNIGSIDYRWNDLFVGSGTIYMDKTRIIRMGDYTRHNGAAGHDISALIFDNSGKHLDISDIRHVNIEGDVSINNHVDIKEQLTVLSDVSFMSKFYVEDDTSFNNHVDIKEQLTALSDVSFMSKFVVIDDSSFNAHVDVSGVLHIKQSLTADGLVTTGTKIYTIYENNSAGNPTTRLIIDPSGDGVPGSVAEQGEVVIMGNLDVKGTSTFIQSTNVDISDNIIRMNANHNAVTDGGIAVKNSSNVDKLFTYNNPGDYWTTNDTNINLGPNGGVVTSGFMNIDNVNINGNTIDVDSGDLVLKSDTGQVQVTALQNMAITANQGSSTFTAAQQTTITSTSGNTSVTSGQQTTIASQAGQTTINSGTQTTITSGQQTTITSTAGNTALTSAQDTQIQSQSGQVVVEQVTFSSNTISTTGSLDLNLTAAGGDIFTQNTNLDLGTGVLTVNGVVNAHVPTGAIILWYGNSGNVPTGWAICNGGSGTPNLSGKFVVCSGSSQNSYSEGGTGGQNFPTLTEQQIPAHNHGASSQNTDVNHNHPATSNSAQTDVNHNHPATSNSANASGDHNHTAASSSTSNSTSNSTLVVGEDGQEHAHPGGQHYHPEGQHSHTEGSHAHSGAQHTHQFSTGNHTHPGNINFRFSTSEGGDGTQSILTDDQDGGTLNLGIVGGSLQMQQAGAHSGNTGQAGGNTGNAAGGGTGQSAGGGTGNPAANYSSGQATSNHTHRNSSVNTTTNTTTNTNTNTSPAGGSHNHGITTNTGQTSINHNHPITTNTGQTTIDHNHVIQTQQTGGGQTFDNRPEYYSLWYIMKL